jgi:hypothetical protein
VHIINSEYVLPHTLFFTSPLTKNSEYSEMGNFAKAFSKKKENEDGEISKGRQHARI